MDLFRGLIASVSRGSHSLSREEEKKEEEELLGFLDVKPHFSGFMGSSSWKSAVGIVTQQEHAWFSSHIYKVHEEKAPLKVIEGWELFARASDFGLNKEGYAAAAYISNTSKNIVISQRGTADEGGVYTDVFLFFTEVPYHIHLASTFTECVQQRLCEFKGEDAHLFSISYTGHSLGAVIAACCACKENRYAVIFDSPGEAPFLRKLLGKQDLSDIRHLILSFVSKPNLANTVHEHAGNIVRLITGVENDLEVVHIQRMTEFLETNKTFIASYILLPTIRMNLPRGIDENLGIKINYLLRHRDRHMMKIFKRSLREGNKAVREEVIRWPMGALQCFLYDTCDAHIVSSKTSDLPVVRASKQALETFYEVNTYQKNVITEVECGDQLFRLLVHIHNMPLKNQVNRLLQMKRKQNNSSTEYVALVHITKVLRMAKCEFTKTSLVINIPSVDEHSDKHEVLSGFRRWESELRNTFQNRMSKL